MRFDQLGDVLIAEEPRKFSRGMSLMGALLQRYPMLQQDLDIFHVAVPARVVQSGTAVVRALLHDLTVVTRNTGDFTGCGVLLLNPFRAS